MIRPCSTIYLALITALPATLGFATATLELVNERLGTGAYMTPEVSADGTLLTGSSGGRAVTWSVDSGFTYLDPLEIYSVSYVSGMTDDGSRIVGRANNGTSTGTGIYWDSNGIISHPMVTPRAIKENSNGYYIVGNQGNDAVYVHRQPQHHPHEDEPYEVTVLPHLPEYVARTGAYDVSNDGSVVVGYSGGCGISTSCKAVAWYRNWDIGGVALVNLGSIIGTTGSSIAYAVSSDGNVVVGSSSSGQPQAFRWNENTGMVGLGYIYKSNPASNRRSIARSVSADGDVIVGEAAPGVRAVAGEGFLWTAGLGLRSLQTLAEAEGLDLTSVILLNATDVSADGKTIVGWASTSSAPRERTYVLKFTELPIAGDVNLDGAVTVQDLLLMQQYILSTRTLTAAQFLRADIAPLGGDEKVNVGDMLVLNRILNSF